MLTLTCGQGHKRTDFLYLDRVNAHTVSVFSVAMGDWLVNILFRSNTTPKYLRVIQTSYKWSLRKKTTSIQIKSNMITINL